MTDIKTKRRGPPFGTTKTSPIFPEKVKRIVVLRDVHKMTFDEISRTLSAESPITKMGVCIAYHKWRDWAYAENM